MNVLSQEAVDILNSFEWGNKTVFHVTNITMSHEWAEFKKELMARGLLKENLTLHDLRHEATSRYFERRRADGTALLQIYEVRQITGHKTLDVMFNTYVNKFDPTKVVAIQGF
jgi:integrase